MSHRSQAACFRYTWTRSNDGWHRAEFGSVGLESLSNKEISHWGFSGETQPSKPVAHRAPPVHYSIPPFPVQATCLSKERQEGHHRCLVELSDPRARWKIEAGDGSLLKMVP